MGPRFSLSLSRSLSLSSAGFETPARGSVASDRSRIQGFTFVLKPQPVGHGGSGDEDDAELGFEAAVGFEIFYSGVRSKFTEV